MICLYCGSKLFEQDRTCPQCGGPAGLELKNNISKVKKSVVSIADAWGYLNDTTIMFRGKTMLNDSNTHINSYGSSSYRFTHSMEINIVETKFDPLYCYKECPKSIKIVLESSIVSMGGDVTSIGKVRLTIPNAVPEFHVLEPGVPLRFISYPDWNNDIEGETFGILEEIYA